MPHPDALPGFDKAVIQPGKLVDYALNPDHPKGGSKARVFAAALGFTRENWPDLAAAILAALQHHPAVEREIKPYGREFAVDLSITGPAGSAIVRTGWMIDNGSDVPRLTTIYVSR